MGIQETSKNVKFGNYPQTANGDIQPIDWQVLAIEDNKMLLLSKYGLEAKRFDVSSNNWKNSEIRQWLNGDFYNKAFSEQERKNINPSNLSDAGTTDNVFLLSKEEVERYFAKNKLRKCNATEYAKATGDYVSSDNGYSYWWLRSLLFLDDSLFVYYVNIYGAIRYYYALMNFFVVRPAFWINL